MIRWSLLIVVLTSCLVGCGLLPDPSPAPPPNAVSPGPAGADPAPVLPADGQRFDATGGVLDDGAVSVDVPSGAVAEGSAILVRVGPELGTITGPFASELAGRPVSVDHDQPLRSALTLSWDVAQLDEQQRNSVVLARWDPELKVWEPSTVKPRWSGTTLTAEIDQFSIWDWFADVNQGVGSFVGARIDAPTCTTDKLPDWVRSTVDPDQDLAAAAIRVCFEKDKFDRVTVRIANNRPFTQQLQMTRGDQRWAWTWPGDTSLDPADLIVYGPGHDLLDSGTKFLLPPLSTQAVGIARPEKPGSVHIQAESVVNRYTMLADFLSFGVGKLPVGGTENPYLNALMQVMYECGAKHKLAANGPKDIAIGVIQAINDCANEIQRPDSEFGQLFEALSRKAIARGGLSSVSAIKANRAVHEIRGKLVYLQWFQLEWYVADQVANNATRPLAWSITGRGKEPTLGDWNASCSIYSKDSNELYRNIALRDEFADTSKELWQFSGLKKAVRKAVGPLHSCSVGYRTGLAAYLPGDWGDPKAARVVAAELVGDLPDASLRALDTAYAPPACKYPSHKMVDGEVPSRLIEPGFVALRSTFPDALEPARVDMDGDGNKDLITLFVCGRGGVNWSDILGMYGVGTRLIGFVDLRDYNEAEHSDVESMTPIAGGLRIQYRSYTGAGFDFEYWQATVQLRNGKGRLVDIRRR